MFEYRTAGPGDADAIALLHVRSWRESYRGEFSDDFLDREQPEERLRVWRARLAEPPPDQYVGLALERGGLVGFVCAYGHHDPRWGAFIDNLHVAREARRSGVAASLVRRAGAWLARESPGTGVYLWVLESNAPARRFYERIGARNAGVSVMETHGGVVVRSCRYVWPSVEALTSD